jgi:transcription-repair coupling factor (superfamily II helicase)
VRAGSEVEDARRELRDRFGPLPEAAARLLDVVALRIDARALRLERLEVRAGRALLTFAPSTPVPPQRLVELLRAHGRRLRAVREFVLEATVPREPWRETFQAVVRLLAEFRGPGKAPR